MENLEDFNLDLDPEEVLKAGRIAVKDISKDEDTKGVQGFNEIIKRQNQDREDSRYLD